MNGVWALTRLHAFLAIVGGRGAAHGCAERDCGWLFGTRTEKTAYLANGRNDPARPDSLRSFLYGDPRPPMQTSVVEFSPRLARRRRTRLAQCSCPNVWREKTDLVPVEGLHGVLGGG
jgi:hypothetical protein